MIYGNKKSHDEVVDILEYGFSILAKANLRCFPYTLEFANELDANTYGVKTYRLPSDSVKWSDWYLLFQGKKYYSQFKDYYDWL